jgi:hypothetical protein
MTDTALLLIVPGTILIALIIDLALLAGWVIQWMKTFDLMWPLTNQHDGDTSNG